MRIGKFVLDIDIKSMIESNENNPWSIHCMPGLIINKGVITRIEPEEVVKQEILSNANFLVNLSNRTGITKEEMESAVRRLILRVINNHVAFYYGKIQPDKVYLDIKDFSPESLEALAKVVDLTCANGDKMFKVGKLKRENKEYADVYDNIPFKQHTSCNRLVLMRGINEFLDFTDPEEPLVIESAQENIEMKPSINLFRIRADVPGTEEGACIVSESAIKKLRAKKKYLSRNIPELALDYKEIVINNVKHYYAEVTFDAELGDKIIDAHSNKSIISKIVPDNEMPIINNKRVEMIFNPSITKRKNYSCLIEERLSNLSDGNEQIIVEQYETDAFSKEYNNETEFEFNGNKYNGFYGTTKFWRPDQIAVEKLQKCKMTLGDAWLRFYPSKVFDSMLQRTDIDYAIERLLQITETLGITISDAGMVKDKPFLKDEVNPDWFEIKAKLNRDIIPIGSPETIPLTVLDEATTTKMCYYRLQSGKYVVLPPHPFTMNDNIIIIDSIRAAFNRIVAEDQSIERNQITRYIGEYRDLIANEMKGKGGAIYNVVYPRINLIYGVAYNADIPEDVVIVPKIFKSHLRNAIVIRMPSHSIHNIKTMKIQYEDVHAIGINHKTMKSMDGDFDGDTLMVIPITKNEYSILMDETKVISIGEHTYCGAKDVEDDTKYIAGLTGDEIIKNQLNATRRHSNIKRFTAMAGAIGIAIRNLALSTELTLEKYIKYGNFYHILAQAALDEKHNTAGVKTPIEALIENYYSNDLDENLIKSCLKKLSSDPGIVNFAKIITYVKSLQSSSKKNILSYMKSDPLETVMDGKCKVYGRIKELIYEHQKRSDRSSTVKAESKQSLQVREGCANLLSSTSES